MIECTELKRTRRGSTKSHILRMGFALRQSSTYPYPQCVNQPIERGGGMDASETGAVRIYDFSCLFILAFVSRCMLLVDCRVVAELLLNWNIVTTQDSMNKTTASPPTSSSLRSAPPQSTTCWPAQSPLHGFRCIIGSIGLEEILFLYITTLFTSSKL
jgi:hypothetical protein